MAMHFYHRRVHDLETPHGIHTKHGILEAKQIHVKPESLIKFHTCAWSACGFEPQ